MSLSTLYRKYTPIQVRSWISELREAGGRRQAWKAVQRGEYESTYPAECAYMRNRGEISLFLMRGVNFAYYREQKRY